MRSILRNTRRGWVVLNEADKGGSTGGQAAGESNPNAEPANPTEENEPEPTGNTLEEKLSSAKTIIGQLFSRAKSLAGLTKERDDAQAESARLQQQFDAATGEATSAKNELATVKGELATAKSTIASITSERDTAQGNVTRLETLCGVKGIDSSKTVPPASEPDSADSKGAQLAEQWSKLKGKAKSEFYRAHKTDLDAYSAAHASKSA
jgi:chromosome segregation ATPase